MQDLFDVSDVSDVSENTWYVIGRCLETISVDSALYSAVGRSYIFSYKKDKVDDILVEPLGMETHAFLIKKITAYGMDFETLEGGMTARLLVAGEHGDALKQTKYLVSLA